MINALALGLAFLTTGGSTIYDFKMKDIDGKEVALSKFKGKVLLVVNVASRCGNTPQYETLQKLYTQYQGRGFAVLGFPANEFGAQEPGTDPEIKHFCTSTYGVTFPMFSKIVVKGEGIHPLYQWLTQSVEPKKDIEWNFAKFLVGCDGKVLARFGARTKPDSEEVVNAIKSALESKASGYGG